MIKEVLETDDAVVRNELVSQLAKGEGMRGVLLAAGTGSRLWPVSLAVNKHLLPIHDKPMFYYPLSVLMLNGIRDVTIIIRSQDEELFRSLVGDGARLGMDITYGFQDEASGIGGALSKVNLADREDDIFLLLGDNLFYGSSLVEFFEVNQRPDGARIFAYPVANPSEFGVVALDDEGRAISLEEKPTRPRSNLAVVGAYIYSRDVFQMASDQRPSDRGELEISGINHCYMREQRLDVRRLPRGTAWLDAGTFDGLQSASGFVRTIEERQGSKIACLEEIAWRNGWISDDALVKIGSQPCASQFQAYLLGLLQGVREADR